MHWQALFKIFLARRSGKRDDAGGFRGRSLARQLNVSHQHLRNRARLKNRRLEQKSGLGDDVGEDDRGELAIFGAGAQGQIPIFLSKAGNRGSARKSSKPAHTQYSAMSATLAFSCSMPCAKQAKAWS